MLVDACFASHRHSRAGGNLFFYT